MKKFIFAFFLLLITGSCYSVSIDVQESVPANTVWSFSVMLPSANDFDEAKVFLDGSRLISFYTSPSNEIVADEEDSARLFSSTEPIGSRVYFLVSPLSEGEHRIVLEVDDETSDEEEVEFFEIYDAGDKATLQNQINSVKGSVNSLIEQVNKFEEKLDKALTEEDKQALQSSIDELSSSLASLESKIEELAFEVDEKADVLVRDIELLKQEFNEQKVSPGIGFISLADVKPETQTAIVLIVVVIVAAVLVVKFKDKLGLKKGLYGKRKKEEVAVFSRREEDIAGQVLQEAEETKKGKWAFGKEKPGEGERKRFNVGDLIKK